MGAAHLAASNVYRGGHDTLHTQHVHQQADPATSATASRLPTSWKWISSTGAPWAVALSLRNQAL